MSLDMFVNWYDYRINVHYISSFLCLFFCHILRCVLLSTLDFFFYSLPNPPEPPHFLFGFKFNEEKCSSSQDHHRFHLRLCRLRLFCSLRNWTEHIVCMRRRKMKKRKKLGEEIRAAKAWKCETWSDSIWNIDVYCCYRNVAFFIYTYL